MLTVLLLQAAGLGALPCSYKPPANVNGDNSNRPVVGSILWTVERLGFKRRVAGFVRSGRVLGAQGGEEFYPLYSHARLLGVPWKLLYGGERAEGEVRAPL